MKHMVKFTALVCCSLAAASLFADPATGWKQTAGGTYDYNNTANWVNGEINGIFGSDLTLEGAQTITFAADTSLADGLTIAYAGNYAMTFAAADDTVRTLTLGGGITASMSGSSAAVVTFDSSLAIDLDNSGRTITASAANGVLDIKSAIANGSLVIDGNKNLKLAGANTYAGGTTIAGSTYVYVNSETAFGTGDVSINGVLSLCADNNLTMTANNKFYMNADRFAYRSGKSLDIGTGDFVATNSFQFWAEGDSLTIHGNIVDKDGVPSPWKLEKWGSKKLYTYSDAEMPANGKFKIGNGDWYFYGSISGSDFSITNLASNAVLFRMHSANTYSGTLSMEGARLYVYASAASAVPNGASVRICESSYLCGSANQKVADMLANGQVTVDSKGAICFGSDESGNIDLTSYPDLALGARDATRKYTGVVTWPSTGKVRIGGGSAAITFPNADMLPASGDIELGETGKLIVSASNGTTGTIRVPYDATLFIEDANGALPNAKIVVEAGGTLQLRSPSGASDVLRANDVTLKAGTLTFEGHKNYAVKHKIGKLTLMTMPGAGGTPRLTWSTGNSKLTMLEIGSVERPDLCFLNVSGGNPGLTNFESGWNVVIKSGVENTAEGTVGTTTAPFVPWIRNGLANLVYNDPETGLRFHTSDERQVYSSAYSDVGPVAPGENMLINYSGDIVFTGENATVATFSFNNKENQNFKMPDGILKVTSGVIGCTYNKVHPQVAVDLCNKHGYILGAYNRAPFLEGSIIGTDKGLTIANDDVTRGNTIEVWASGTYSGDVYIHGGIWLRSATFLPGGIERPGNIYLDGYWRCGDCSVQVNGIYGAGLIKLENGFNNAIINMGADGQDGDYDGRVNRTNGTLTFVKIGKGRQRFGGECTHNGATTVSAGTLQVDGAFTQSAVTVAEGATLAGCGTFGKAVTLAAGAKLEVGSAKLGESDAEMNFEGGIKFQGDSAVTFKVLGKTSVATLVGAPTIENGGKLTISLDSKDLKGGEYCLFRSDSALNIAYSRGANCGPLSLRNDGKELWMRKNTSLTITIR